MATTYNRRHVLTGGVALAIGGVMAPAAVAQGWAGRKVLVAYHSRTGNTHAVAEMIHRQSGGDLVRIEPAEPYPEDYDALVAQNVEEQRAGFLPPLLTSIANIEDYDIVFLGSPLWNVRLTPPVRSFLASHDLGGKTIVPFVTYIVSGLGRSRDDIAEIAPDSRILPGLAVLGEEATQAEGSVQDWLATVPMQ